MHNPRLQWMNYLTNRWTSRSREKKFAREPKNKFSKQLSTDDNWWINRRNIWYIAFVRTRGIYESWILLNHHVLFFYMSTCNSRLSDLIVPIAGLSIVWFITATKLHSNGNTMGWQQHGRKRILLELNFSKLSKIFSFSLDYLIQHWNEYVNEQCRNLLIERKKVWLTWKFFSKLLLSYYNWSLTLETREIIKTRV